LKEIRKIGIWFLIFVIVAGSLYFLNNTLPAVKSIQFSENDIIQYAPFILKFDSANQYFISQFSTLPFELPQYDLGFLVKYNLDSDLYVFKSDEKASDYIKTISKSSLNGKITRSWLNGFQVFQIDAGFTYYITDWKDFLFVSNNSDALKSLFDRIIQGLHSSDQKIPDLIFNESHKNVGFVDAQGKDIFEKFLTMPFVTFRYPLIFYPSNKSIEISFATNETGNLNNLKVFNFEGVAFETAFNDSYKLEHLLQDNFLSVFPKKYNVSLDKIFVDNSDFSEFILFENNTSGLILYSNIANNLIASFKNDFKAASETYNGTEILKIEVNGNTLYVSSSNNFILLFEDKRQILNILDNKVEDIACNCSAYLKFDREFNNVAPTYNVPQILSPFENFSVMLIETNGTTKIEINME
jgi:hypothetical protein